ncbi:hypothetical protein [Aneurinibacillus terranovensis]|uniref:hypothetical protein n=1 Tax=Aneurinibacillus terranovensis TaxID=278991 RepID=UPI0004035421|nr:hypothetical protein [Aneurinibacillus terranovensis]
MKNNQGFEVSDYYIRRYGKPANDNEAIELLADIFKELMDSQTVTMEIKDGIADYYHILLNRDVPAFEWMVEAFHVTSKKDSHKRNFPYVCGMLRQWLKHGYGHIPSQEEEDIINYFEEVSGEETTMEARWLIKKYMATYGAIKVTRMIGSLHKSNDVSYIMALVLGELLQIKFGDTMPNKTSSTGATGKNGDNSIYIKMRVNK